ncbi:MAG: glycosyltransferase family 4 protein [Patescibacteria group bacterium]|jgi:hypothetical protein|nr:glycosyltransferase family 4 protein [Patescibacteria group bacterium]
MSQKIWIDLTDIGSWTGNFTGIQRVVYNLAYQFYENNEANFFRYDIRTGSFYEADFATIIKRFNTTTSTVHQKKTKDLTQVILKAYTMLPYWIKLAIPKYVKLNTVKACGYINQTIKKVISYSNHKGNVLTENTAIFGKEDIILVFGNNWDRSIFIDDLSNEKQKVGFRVYQLVYDLIPVLGPQFFGIALFATYARYIFEAIIVSDGLFCISKSTQKDLKSFCNKVGISSPRTCVVRLGDDLVKIKPIQPPVSTEKNFIICVGTIEVRKNHTLLYYVWKEAMLRGISLPQLIIIGKIGWNTENIRYTLQHDPDIQNKIIVLDNVSDAELEWFYENCLFSVYPSMYEGWGLPIAESLAYGKLCLASKTSSMPEIAGDLIDYFSPYDSGECLEKINEYSTNLQKLKNKEEDIKKLYKSTPWSTTYKEVKDFIGI